MLDDDEVDAVDTEPQIHDSVKPDLPACSEMTAGNAPASWAAAAEDTADSATDATLTKESGENWDEELSLDLHADNEEAVACRYNYCVVQRSSFPLGYERSKTV